MAVTILVPLVQELSGLAVKVITGTFESSIIYLDTHVLLSIFQALSNQQNLTYLSPSFTIAKAEANEKNKRKIESIVFFIMKILININYLVMYD
ncbi:hypothetical protein HOA93_01080 [bacterium]|nr:hypothetical protein [bacterium]